MKKILCVILVACLLAGCAANLPAVTTTQTPDPTTTSTTTVSNTTTQTVVPTTTQAPVPTTTVTEPPVTTAPPTQPTTEPTQPTTVPTGPGTFTLSFAGDCTLGDNYTDAEVSGTYTKVVKDNYDYPLSNVKHIFEADDFTLVNLEVALTDSDPTEEEMKELATHRFRFRGPKEYTQILTGSGVEFASAANNHSRDYGQAGLQDTWDALDEAGLHYASFGKTCIATTESGLKIGIMAIFFEFIPKSCEMICNNLRAQGAEIIIMSIHWGDEGTYLPIEHQVELGHWAIDAGVDIVYGHHSHTLMPIETYNGGIIYYSLANFSFGGNRNPVDKDTAIIQQQIIRDEEGNISLGETTVIPCRVSTKDSWNDYCPTPYEPGSHEYNRVMAKIEGSWDGTP